MATIHIFLQGKGGVGKSFCSMALAQYLVDSDKTKPICVDADPVNATFASYPSFQAEKVELDPRQFDALVIKLVELPEDAYVVIDNGASTFVPFSRYLLQEGAADLLLERGHRLVINTVIVGGNALEDTIHGFADLAEQFTEGVGLQVWLNPFFGPVAYHGKEFWDFPIYQEHKSKIGAVIQLPELSETFGYDLRVMLEDRKTFQEAIFGDAYNLMARQRLKMLRDKIYGQLAQIPEL